MLIADDGKMDRGGKRRYLFEHRIFPPGFYRIHAIPGLLLTVRQRATLGGQTQNGNGVRTATYVVTSPTQAL